MTDLQGKLLRILKRHIRDADVVLTEDEFVRQVYMRYEAERAYVPIDPNE